jgi:hypothetical protein
MRKLTALLATGLVLFSGGCTHLDSGRGSAPGAAAESASFTKPVSFAILQDYVKGESLQEVAKDFALMKELGVRTLRGSFAWGDLEPSRGRYDLIWLQQFADLAAREGMQLRPYIGYTPKWAAKGGKDSEAWNDPPARMEDWTNFVSAVTTALRSRDNILSYEIYNEENVPQWWDGSPAEYNAVLRSASGVIRSVAPGKPVVFGGMVYPDDDWVKAACVTNRNGSSFDILPFHAYPETWTEPEITVENYLDQGTPGNFRKNFIPAVDSWCGRKPVWINEAGYANSKGKTEADQANWWARALATFLADPRVEHIGIYQIKERVKGSAVIGDAQNYYLGITKPDRTKKLAFFTLQRLVALLDTKRLTVADGELKVNVTAGRKGELYHHLFVRPDGRQVLFVWDKRENPTVSIETRKGSAATEYGLDGKPVPFGQFDGRVLHRVALTKGTVRIFEIAP